MARVYLEPRRASCYRPIRVKPPDAANVRFARDAWIRALQSTASIEREPTLTLPLLIERLAEQYGSAPALESPDSSLSYRELALRCRRYARWGLAQGLGSGDVVALLMPNCPEYLAVWLGLTRLGVTVALLNSQLTGELLAHSIEIAAPRWLIVGAALAPGVAALRGRFPRLAIGVNGASSEDFDALDAALEHITADPVSAAECALPSLDATALYIYTSGTTGKPKAARVSHYRVLQWSRWFAGMMDTQPHDRMYNCLPLYHSVGGVVACGATLLGGGAVVIRERFSASQFWADVCAERCTLFQYIGELCRYLLAAPRQAQDTAHALRLACGNGLRPEIWAPFQARFRVPRILEYYAATEGNFSLYNCEQEPGAIGRMPPFIKARSPVALLRLDAEREQPLRDAAGFCVACTADEVGEAVGFVPRDAAVGAAGRFEGYVDAEASARKLLHDVFEPGDCWYRTGDLMRRDARGFYYFVDRLGDTYRWKGENVSAAEVWSVLAGCPGVVDGVVYGVTVPGADGRAGMAALVTGAGFELAALHARVAAALPEFARPKFLRLLPELEATGTFKPKKQELVRAGFDPAHIADGSLYFDDPRAGAYVTLDAALHADIVGGVVRV